MRIIKLLNLSSVLLSVTAFVALVLPIYSTSIIKGESYNMVIRCYNLVEFSPWGAVLVLSPLVLLGLMLSNLNSNAKTLGLLILILLYGTALCASTSAAYIWISEVSTSFIKIGNGHLIYALLFVLAMISFYISNTVKSKNYIIST